MARQEFFDTAYYEHAYAAIRSLKSAIRIGRAESVAEGAGWPYLFTVLADGEYLCSFSFSTKVTHSGGRMTIKQQYWNVMLGDLSHAARAILIGDVNGHAAAIRYLLTAYGDALTVLPVDEDANRHCPELTTPEGRVTVRFGWGWEGSWAAVFADEPGRIDKGGLLCSFRCADEQVVASAIRARQGGEG